MIIPKFYLCFSHASLSLKCASFVSRTHFSQPSLFLPSSISRAHLHSLMCASLLSLTSLLFVVSSHFSTSLALSSLSLSLSLSLCVCAFLSIYVRFPLYISLPLPSPSLSHCNTSLSSTTSSSLCVCLSSLLCFHTSLSPSDNHRHIAPPFSLSACASLSSLSVVMLSISISF